MKFTVNEIVEMLKVNITKIVKGEYISIYLVGSLAVGDFVVGRSDCDIIVVTTHKKLHVQNLLYDGQNISVQSNETHRSKEGLHISVCYRSLDSILYSFRTLNEYKGLVCGKEIGCVEDALLVAKQSILISGKQICKEIVLPSRNQFYSYLILLEHIAETNSQSEIVKLMTIAKNILLYAKHYYYLWTQNIVYSSSIINIFKEEIPCFAGIEIMEQAYKVTCMTWLQCHLYLKRNTDIVMLMEGYYDRFISLCNKESVQRGIATDLKGIRGRGIELYVPKYNIDGVLREYIV